MAQMPSLGSRWPEWAEWVSFKLCFARAALEQGFAPTAPTTRHGSDDTLIYGCNYTDPKSRGPCSYRFRLVWDAGAGEDVVVEANTVHSHPLSALDPVATRFETEQIIAGLRIDQERLWDRHCKSGEEHLLRLEEMERERRQRTVESEGGDYTQSSTRSPRSSSGKRLRESSNSSSSLSPPALTSPTIHSGPHLPVLNSSFPDVESFRTAITTFAAEEGFKAWVAGGAHGAPRCRMICSRSRKSTPGEAKCGFSISVRQNTPGDDWVVEELDPRHTHRMLGKGEGSVERERTPTRVGRKRTSENGSGNRKKALKGTQPKVEKVESVKDEDGD